MKTSQLKDEASQENPVWLTRGAVSKLVGLTPRTLMKMESNSQFPRPAKLPNKRVRYFKNEVFAWMRDQADPRTNDSASDQEQTPSTSCPPHPLADNPRS